MAFYFLFFILRYIFILFGIILLFSIGEFFVKIEVGLILIVYEICEDFLCDFSSTIELCTFFVCTLRLSDWKPFILVFLRFERWFGLVIDTLLIGLQYASQSLIGFVFWMMYVRLLGSSTLMKIWNFFEENTKKIICNISLCSTDA